MRRTVTTWLFGGLFALTATAWAQEPSPTPAPTGDTSTMTDHGTVTREQVRTWTMDIDSKEWEVHPATPSYEGTTGLFHMPTAYTLPKGKFSFSLFRDNLDRDPKDVDISIHGVSLGIGLTDRIELYGNFGLRNRVDADALFQSGYVNDYPFVSTPWETGTGDAKLGLKIKLLDDYMFHNPLALSVRGFVKLATADENKGLGTGKTSFGGDLVASKGIANTLDIHASIGFVKNGDPDSPRAVNIANAFRWAIGVNVPACTKVQLQAELMKTKYTGDSDFKQTDPLDFVVGPVFWLRPGIFIRPAISWNFNFNDRGLNSSSKSWTGRHISIGYYPGFGCRQVAAPPPPPPPPPPSNGNPTVNCEVERTTILPGESVRVRANASDPDGDTLTYQWSASAGRITGSGPSVTFESAGMTPPASSTITVRVSDGRGGSAESTCPVRMNAPERKAEVITCVSGGFPRNLARLNNVDKACLDDVATRLRQDPRSRVIIVGHADSGERFPEVIARKRAEAAKDYLVKQRGVEESRVTVRSAAATKAVDSGTDAAARARNRRVEVIFVPEGATAPDN